MAAALTLVYDRRAGDAAVTGVGNVGSGDLRGKAKVLLAQIARIRLRQDAARGRAEAPGCQQNRQLVDDALRVRGRGRCESEVTVRELAPEMLLGLRAVASHAGDCALVPAVVAEAAGAILHKQEGTRRRLV